MKYIILLSLISSSLFVNAQDFMDKITQKSCECIDNIDENLEKSQYNMELGVCMIEASMPYKKQLKKEYKIDLERIETSGEDLGRLIGVKMATACPNSLLRMVNKSGANDEDSEDEAEESVISGKVTSINADKFVEFTIEDSDGKQTVCYWFSFIESDLNLINQYKSLKDKQVQVNVVSQEMFDARINEYRMVNVIKELQIED